MFAAARMVSEQIYKRDLDEIQSLICPLTIVFPLFIWATVSWNNTVEYPVIGPVLFAYNPFFLILKSTKIQ